MIYQTSKASRKACELRSADAIRWHARTPSADARTPTQLGYVLCLFFCHNTDSKSINFLGHQRVRQWFSCPWVLRWWQDLDHHLLSISMGVQCILGNIHRMVVGAACLVAAFERLLESVSVTFFVLDTASCIEAIIKSKPNSIILIRYTLKSV